MKNYVSPDMELVIVNITDVITTSNDVEEEVRGNTDINSSWIFS